MNKKALSVLVMATLVASVIAVPAADAAKKKKKKKKPKPAACADFVPGEFGTEKPSMQVTDAATEEAPVEQQVTLAASAADLRLLSAIPEAGPLAATYDYFNVQVDSAAADVGLHVLVEFATRRDVDLNLLHPDGSYAARARSFNPVVGTPGEIFSAPGHGGEGTDHSEKLLGIRTSDCGGWTLEVANYFGESMTPTVKLWLGEAVTDPQAPGAEPR